MKVMTYQQLLAVHKKGIQEKFNQGITDEAMELVDPAGVNLVQTVYVPFHNEQNHHRCLVLLKFRNREEPVRALIDIDANQYDELEELDSWKEKMRITE